MDEILWCYHSNETSSAVLSHGTIYLVRSSNFWVCGRNPMVLPFKWNLFSSTFTWCYLFSMLFHLLSLSTKSYGVPIQKISFQQYFHISLFTLLYFPKKIHFRMVVFVFQSFTKGSSIFCSTLFSRHPWERKWYMHSILTWWE